MFISSQMYSRSLLVILVDTATVLQKFMINTCYISNIKKILRGGGPIVTSGSEMTASGVPLFTSGVQLIVSGTVCFRCPDVHSDVTTNVQVFTSGTSMTVLDVHFRLQFDSIMIHFRFRTLVQRHKPVVDCGCLHRAGLFKVTIEKTINCFLLMYLG